MRPFSGGGVLISTTVVTLLHVSGYYTGVFSSFHLSLGSNATTVLEKLCPISGEYT